MPELAPAERDAIAYLRSLVAIRERCQQVLGLACADRLHYFAYHPEKLSEVADYVAKITRDAYPRLDVPFHSRWRHCAGTRPPWPVGPVLPTREDFGGRHVAGGSPYRQGETRRWQSTAAPGE